MITVDEYLDRAKRHTGTQSDRQLSIFLGVVPGTISQIRTKRTWPSDDLMLKIADAANMDAEQALIDLNIWRNEGPARAIYERLARAMTAACLALFLIFAGQPEPALANGYSENPSETLQGNSIRYHRFKTLFRTVIYRLFLRLFDRTRYCPA